MTRLAQLAFLLTAAGFQTVLADSDVAQLNKDTFDDFMKEHDLVLAECRFRVSDSLLDVLCDLFLLITAFNACE